MNLTGSAAGLPNGTANGDHVNGMPAVSPGNYLHPSRDLGNAMPFNVPEIESFTLGYVPVASLVSRLSQETFNDLSILVTELSDMASTSKLANGCARNGDLSIKGHHSTYDQAIVLKKKLRVLEWTNKWRSKFIKSLVLTRWTLQADAVRKVIDLRFWQLGALTAYQSATQEIGLIKRHLVPTKEPGPNIKSSLEALALGQVSWGPGSKHLKAPHLAPQQMLQVLHRVNTLLSLRLNLYEQIPFVFRDFSIASGRATFRVFNEFEVDLSIADEDPTSQLYFIDFRFAFSPTTVHISPGRLLMELEGRANDVLFRDRLQGLFDLLHNFVLTHKLAILRSQAEALLRTYWSEHIVIEPVRRSLVIQYWSTRPGGKNWLEIGIKRGNQRSSTSADHSQRIPHLSVRSFRAGKEVQDSGVELELRDLSLEKTLKQVIARHVSSNLATIAMKLGEGLLYTSGSLRIRENLSICDPMAASLLIQVTTSKAIKIVQESVSGHFAITPKSRLNDRAQLELNRLASPNMEAPLKLSSLRALTCQQEVSRIAQVLGWEQTLSVNLAKEATQQRFPKATQEIIMFRHPRWSLGWALAFTTSLEGDSWWIVELPLSVAVFRLGVSKEPDDPMPPIVQKLILVDADLGMSPVFEPSQTAMAQVEHYAAGMICQFEDTRCLANLGIQHKVQPPHINRPAFSILIRFPSVETGTLSQDVGYRPTSQSYHTVKLEYQQLDARSGEAVRIAKARLNSSRPIPERLASSITTLAINRSNSLYAIRLQHGIGQTPIPQLRQQLTAFERLQNYVFTIEPYESINLQKISLSSFEFRYAGQLSPLAATIHFGDDSLHMSLSARNPHKRILDHLNTFLLAKGIVPLAAMLRITLPLLSALSTLESLHKKNDVHVLIRSEQWYEVRYAAPALKGGFDIRLRHRRGIPYWFVTESSIKKSEAAADEDEWARTLKVLTRGTGHGWRGVHGGIIAEIEPVGDLIQKLDGVYRDTEPLLVNSNGKKRKAESDIVQAE